MEANYFIVLFTLGLFLLQDTAVAQETINVNMNGKGCDNPDGYVVNDNQIYSLYYDYSPQIQGSRDHCDVSLRTSLTIRRLKYYVTTLDLLDCGVEILVYYNPSISATPTRKLSCNDDKKLPITETSNFNSLKFSLRKTTSQANTIRILIRVTTDHGPDIGLVKGESEFYETPLQPGAIAGIAIAGAIIVVALIGLAIYCCIRNRRENLKHVEASGAPSASSVFTSGTSQNMFPANNKRSRGSYGSMEDVRSTTTSSTGKNANAYSNKGYKIDGDEKSTNNYYNKGYKADSDEKKPHRQNSYSRRDKNQGGHLNEAYEQSDVSADGTDFSRGESGRALKYAKNKQYSRTEEYQMSKVNKMPVNGILKTRSKSPNRSQSSTESSTDNNALVYGYSHSSSAHPNTQHIVTVEKTRSRSHSRGSRSVRSGSTGSQGRSSSASRATGKDKKMPSTGRQYGDLSTFLDEKGRKPRSRSNSTNRKRNDSRASERELGDISFSSSKKNTVGKRVHIQGVESDI